MKKVDTETLQELLTRGVSEVIDKESIVKKIKTQKKLRVKLGIDPTSPHIHLGRAISLLKLRAFQKIGATPVFIIGDFTGTIGDTSDKDAERPMLSPLDIKKNLKTYLAQAGKVIDLKKSEVYFNSKWLARLSLKDVIFLADLFSVSDFIARENIAKRLAEGKRVSLREVLYPLLQGYDSVKVRADIELGGTDQKFNLLAGRTMQKANKQVPQDLIMMKIIPGLDGRKMSSSWGNTINISDQPEDMYGKIMSLRDELVSEYFESCTEMKKEEVARANTLHPKERKMKLADEIVTLYHGEKGRVIAQKQFTQAFVKKEIPDNIKTIVTKEKQTLGDILVKEGLVPSKSEFRRLVIQKAIHHIEAGGTINDPHYVVGHTITLRIGKKAFIKIEKRT